MAWMLKAILEIAKGIMALLITAGIIVWVKMRKTE